MKLFSCILIILGVFASVVSAGHKLNEAVFAGNPERIKEIIESGEEDVNHLVEGDDGMTALYVASLIGNLDMMNILLNDYNADPLIGDNRGYTPLDLLAAESKYEQAELIMQHAGDRVMNNFVNEKDGFTPIHRAARNNRQASADIIQMMVDKGADINVKAAPTSKKPGATALHVAAEHGHTDLVKTLISLGADAAARRPTSSAWSPRLRASRAARGYPAAGRALR